MHHVPEQGVVILTQSTDPHADYIVGELQDLGASVMRVHTADYPSRVDIEADFYKDHWEGTIVVPHHEMDLRQVRAIYYRRPARFAVDQSMPPALQELALTETAAAFGGIMRILSCDWISYPDCLVHADHKTVQLRALAAAGLRVPRSLITTDPAAAKTFVSACETGTVYKRLGPSYMLYDNDEYKIVYTTLISSDRTDLLESVAVVPALLQERVIGSAEYRITVVQDLVFAAQVRRIGPDSPVDIHADNSAICEPFELPAEVAKACAVATRALGLRFATLDLIERTDGEWIALELNPNGQWLWVEDETGYPIGETIARALTGRLPYEEGPPCRCLAWSGPTLR